MNQDTSELQYFDGTGNGWVITAEDVRYLPVEAGKSSSGFYSGGKAFSRSITPSEFEHLEGIFRQALLNQRDRCAQRIMQSHSFTIKEGGGVREVLLAQNAPEVEQLRRILHAFAPKI